MGQHSRLHFYTVCFAGENGKMRSGVIRLPVRQVSRPALEQVREALGFDENAVLVSQSYLGHMTQKEYETGQVSPAIRLMQASLIFATSAALAGVYLLIR